MGFLDGVKNLLGGDHNPFNGGADIDEIKRKSDKHVMLEPGEQSKLVNSGRVTAPGPIEPVKTYNESNTWDKLTKRPSEFRQPEAPTPTSQPLSTPKPTAAPAPVQKAPAIDMQPSKLRKIRVV